MQLSFIRNTFTQFRPTQWSETIDSDLLIFGFDSVPIVKMGSEAKGESSSIYDLVKLSASLEKTVVCGAYIDVFGGMHKSVIICDCGVLLGISDMVFSVADSEYLPSAYFKVYDTTSGRVGILVADDMFYTQGYSVLTQSDCDYIIIVDDGEHSSIKSTILKAMAHMNGVNILYMCKDKPSQISSNGEIIFLTNKENVNTEINVIKNYRLVGYRQRHE